jgi:hypothetical protein
MLIHAENSCYTSCLVQRLLENIPVSHEATVSALQAIQMLTASRKCPKSNQGVILLVEGSILQLRDEQEVQGNYTIADSTFTAKWEQLHKKTILYKAC